MRYFFDYSWQNYLFYFSHTFVLTIVYMQFINKYLAPRIHYVLMAFSCCLTYIVATRLLVAIRFPAAWTITGPLSLFVCVILGFKGKVRDRLFVLTLIFMEFAVWQSCQAGLINSFNDLFKRTLLFIPEYVVYNFVMIPVCSYGMLKVGESLISIKHFMLFDSFDKNMILFTGVIATFYIYISNNIPLFVGETIGRHNANLVLLIGNGVVALTVGLIAYLFVFRQYFTNYKYFNVKQEMNKEILKEEFMKEFQRSQIEERERILCMLDNWNNQFNAIREALINHRIENYIENEEMFTLLENSRSNDHKENVILDFFLSYVESIARSNDIDCEIQCQLSEYLTLDYVDQCVILFNLLENAINALAHTDKKHLFFYVRKMGDIITIIFDNTVNKTEMYKLSEKDRKTSRFHGYGLMNVKTVVDKYNGDMIIEESMDRFKVTILMSL